MSLHPSEGARYLLELAEVADGEAAARYRAAVLTPDQRFDYELALGLDGAAAVATAGGADQSLEAALLAIARSVARAAGKARADGRPAWPRRVLRWRGPGRGK